MTRTELRTKQRSTVLEEARLRRSTVVLYREACPQTENCSEESLKSSPIIVFLHRLEGHRTRGGCSLERPGRACAFSRGLSHGLRALLCNCHCEPPLLTLFERGVFWQGVVSDGKHLHNALAPTLGSVEIE